MCLVVSHASCNSGAHMATASNENFERLEVANKIREELERLRTIAAADGWSSVVTLISIALAEAELQVASSSHLLTQT